ncbi:fimbria/pilus periplasmic chaperone [Enterobacter asburiae]|uniref:fimbria/pilus periplasmic chaperone n=1 Tax=Enterobacter asburiae TaxID=61645 RepID=UPI002175FAE0|nr:fimbria/pilus periplasmic chaperone [Enterobacter asburiae]MCS5456944.1 fimbria/pilus periplasmic chaperone [Enterobacter asburiae]
MHFLFKRKVMLIMLFFSSVIISNAVNAGGVSLGSTRIIHPTTAKQSSISVRNSSPDASYLIQSWVENKDNNKTSDFIITPPLFVSSAGGENMVRIMYSGSALPTDRETLYYFNARAVPSIDKNKIGDRNILMLATITQIKLFVRPSGLSPAPEKAPELLTFIKSGKKIIVNNPTPYYITLVQMTIDGRNIGDVMVPPKGQADIALPSTNGKSLNFKTMNDYGAAVEHKTVMLN